MIAATAKETKEYVPPDLSANDLKNREIHGKSAEFYGANKQKRDGALMTAGGDWKNTGMQSTNTSSPVKGMN